MRIGAGASSNAVPWARHLAVVSALTTLLKVHGISANVCGTHVCQKYTIQSKIHKQFQKTNEDNPCLPYKTIVRISWDHVSGVHRAGLGMQSVPMVWGMQPIKVLLAVLTVLVTS